MSADAEDFTPPRWALIGAGAMVAVAFGAALLGRAADIGVTRIADSPVTESRLLRIVNADDFSATVTDAGDGSLVRVARAGVDEGFVWGAVNGLSYGRKQAGRLLDAPYELARRADGRLTLTDTTTGQKVFLDAFGKGNAAAFARLLERKEASR